MNFMMVEPTKTKLNAYHFDGKKESAQDALNKWPCHLIDITDSDLCKIVFENGTEVMPGNYIVIENSEPVIYSQSEFISNYKVVYDIRERLHTYMLLD